MNLITMFYHVLPLPFFRLERSNTKLPPSLGGRLQPDSALVLREGRWQQLNAEDLVPGDLVQVQLLHPWMDV